MPKKSSRKSLIWNQFLDDNFYWNHNKGSNKFHPQLLKLMKIKIITKSNNWKTRKLREMNKMMINSWTHQLHSLTSISNFFSFSFMSISPHTIYFLFYPQSKKSLHFILGTWIVHVSWSLLIWCQKLNLKKKWKSCKVYNWNQFVIIAYRVIERSKLKL